jgi:Peptidase C10 family/Spi protease inhibitor/Secretion system C-terminal sorting domain/CUB domain
MKKLIILLLLMPAILIAAPVSQQTAENVAKNVWLERNIVNPQTSLESIYITNVFIEYSTANDALLYVFNINNEGFVMISADDRAYPVLGYSFQSTYEGKDQGSPALEEWINNYNKQIEDVIENNHPAGKKTADAWVFYSSENISMFQNFKAGTKSMEPLLKTIWGQGGYYNDMCPSDASGEALVGCVAVAMVQVMAYYMHPAQGAGSYGYYHPTYGYLSANFGNTSYNWNGIQNSLNTVNDDVALIMSHGGISVNMYYGVTGSASYTENTEDALEDYFGYSTSTNYVNKSSYNTTNWKNLLVSNLDAKKPMIYSGSGSGGHAFNLDGYQSTDHFHFNWGWNGYADGYFYVTNLNPAGEDFTQNQGAVVNIEPISSSYPSYCTGTTTLTTLTGMFEDGSGPLENYQNNANCSWLIQPSTPVDYITIEFIEISTESTNDIITIYEGATTSSPVVGTYSGSTLPSVMNVNGTAALVTFTSNGSTVNSGWKISYYSRPTDFCENLTQLTAPSGDIDDGSGAYEYANTTVCRWQITPPGMQQIILYFDAFDLGSGDIVRVYDAQNQILLDEFTGSVIPSAVVCNATSMQVQFITDPSITADGFEAHYTSSNAIGENPMFESLVIFPNPANDILNIEFKQFENELLDIMLMDAVGKIVKEYSFDSNETFFRTSIDVSDLSQGMYMLKLSQGDKIQYEKLIIQ